MKVVCFSESDGTLSGVGTKLRSQTAALRELGLDAQLVLCVNRGHIGRVGGDAFITVRPLNDPTGVAAAVRRYFAIARALKDVVSSLDKGDVVYLRFPPPIPLYWWVLRKKRRCTVVSEHQSIEAEQTRRSGDHAYRLLDRIFGPSMRRSVDGIVGMTPDIAEYQVGRSGDPAKPHTAIENGIATESVPLRTPPPFTRENLHLLFVGSVSIWHGLDRLLEGLAHHDGTPPVTLHVAGSGRELLALEALAVDRGIADSVRFHGFLSGAPLDRVFDAAHIAVGSLGIHRIGLRQESTLKACEYCARGIPFVIGYDDPNFPLSFPYLMHVPPDDSRIDLRALIAFAEAMYREPGHHRAMRAYAQANLDWIVKMRKLKAFFEEIT